ncbi:hypothetical protein RRG08_064851 [Elysia crispata]|uniref:Uncharacterized protein n=1 Tax=Elysia crispata TaxID=231223 RepID=A0AAE1A4C2_9GAST|nr:hypothetical protein RRG08_064851 [Elysia crispata]
MPWCASPPNQCFGTSDCYFSPRASSIIHTEIRDANCANLLLAACPLQSGANTNTAESIVDLNSKENPGDAAAGEWRLPSTGRLVTVRIVLRADVFITVLFSARSVGQQCGYQHLQLNSGYRHCVTS